METRLIYTIILVPMIAYMAYRYVRPRKEDNSDWLRRKYDFLALTTTMASFTRTSDQLSHGTMHSPLWNGSSFDLHLINRIVSDDVLKRVHMVYEHVSKAGTESSTLRVLDAGCGWGATSFMIAEKHHDLITSAGNNARTQAKLMIEGMTLSSRQADQANSAATSKHLNNMCRFTTRSFEEPLDKHSYASIIAIEALEHATNIEELMLNFANALLPGGSILVVTDVLRPHNEVDATMVDHYSAHWCGPQTRAWQPPIAQQSWKRIAEKAGLQLTRTVDLSETYGLNLRSR